MKIKISKHFFYCLKEKKDTDYKVVNQPLFNNKLVIALFEQSKTVNNINWN